MNGRNPKVHRLFIYFFCACKILSAISRIRMDVDHKKKERSSNNSINSNSNSVSKTLDTRRENTTDKLRQQQNDTHVQQRTHTRDVFGLDRQNVQMIFVITLSLTADCVKLFSISFSHETAEFCVVCGANNSIKKTIHTLHEKERRADNKKMQW